KQNEGQYFTPIPIAKFIIQSLPVREIIERKLENGNVKFLPFVLDYACGSGHFLTEAIEEIQHTINEIDLTPKFREEINEEIQRIQIGTQWTGDYIFGIEKDYRLARTSKVAMFMHGDGEANILFGDGLEDHFEIEKKIVEGYDVIVANPPYAIHGFKPYIKNLSSKFSLFEFLTDNSSEIEVLFVERTKQLLRKDGLACIILPSSILTNKDALLYRKTRELIFQNFEIKAIVECGSETFLATTTNTVILFLSRRDDRWKYDFRCVAEDFILNNKKRLDDFADTNQMLKAYIEHIELEYDDYKTLLAREASEKLMKTQWFIDYQNWFIGLNETVTTKKSNAFLQLTSDAKKEKLEKLFYDKVLSVETEKFYYFLLTMNQQVLVIKTGTDKESQKIFLGYEKRSGKRDAGLAMNLEEGRHITKLYDELDKRNPEKANTYIYHQLLDKPIPVVCDELNNNIAYVPLSECLDFKNVEFSAHVNTSANSQIRFKSKHLLTALSDLTASYSGVTFDKTQQSFTQTSKIILTASNINLESGKITLDSLIYLNENVPLDSSFQLKKNDVFICTSSGSLSHLGKSAFINEDLDYYFGGFCGVLRGGDGLIQKFISIILSHSIEFKSFVSQFNGMNINNLRLTELMKFKIPVPPGKIIEKLLYEFGNLENEEENLIHEVYRLTHETQTLIVDLKGEKRKIRDYFSINDETVNPPKKFGEQYFTYIDIDCIGKGRGSIDFTKKIKGNHAPSRARRIAADKSVIISTVRPNLKGFAFLDSVPADCVFSTGFAVIKSRDENIYKAHLLYYIFQYDTDLMKQMVDAMPKSSYTSITQDDIYNFSIPDVGDSDQAIIVRKLTDIESRMSTLNEKLSKIPSKKENILEKYL
ncbi:MAG: N-6 DNA methylase, partial [Bacteroidota bacterium]